MRPQKITLGEMRDMGVRGILVYCASAVPDILFVRTAAMGYR
jgi:hypothetical protein